MKDFFYPFLKELREINDGNGISVKHNKKTYNFMPSILCCCCDMLARIDVQGMTGHAGRFACSFCLHPGISVKPGGNKKAVIRYVNNEKKYQIRSHNDVIETYGKLKSNPINGIKRVSCMVAAKHFNLIHGFSIDYMHNVLLGVMKKLMNLWLDSRNHTKPYYIKKQHQVILSNRLVSLKPVTEITRKPKSIFLVGEYKANEFRSLLLYYLPFALPGLLEMKYINHFRILSSAIYMLLKKNVSIKSIEDAQLNLAELWNVLKNCTVNPMLP